MDMFLATLIKEHPDLENGFLFQAANLLNWSRLGGMVEDTRSHLGARGLPPPSWCGS